MVSPRVEEFLENLYLRETEGDRCSRVGDEDNGTTQREAENAGYVVTGPDGKAQLTEAGRALGQRVLRRCRLAERLLHDVLLVRKDRTQSNACAFEHVLQDGLDNRICTLLGHPRVCPHGHPIPEGECCKRAGLDPLNEVSALCDGRPNQTGVVAYLSTRDHREIQKLMALGILPGSDIRLIRLFPSYVFELGHTQFTVDRSLAEKIIVHWRDREDDSSS